MTKLIQINTVKEHTTFIVSPLSSTENLMCRNLPRCLIFLYLSGISKMKITRLYESHTIFCNLWFMTIPKQCITIKTVKSHQFQCVAMMLTYIKKKLLSIKFNENITHNEGASIYYNLFCFILASNVGCILK